jgi:uncharacterized protein (DUF2336 family)
VHDPEKWKSGFGLNPIESKFGGTDGNLVIGMEKNGQGLSAEMATVLGDPTGALADDLSGHTVRERGRVLRETADLFLSKSPRYSDQHIKLFENVMLKLLDRVDREVREYLSNRFGALDYAPPRVIRHLANDDAIAVAGPVLQQSPCLDEEFLVGCAKCKSQDHLAAMSLRATLGHQLSDALMERGNDKVVLNLAKNSGAKLSDHGYSLMVDRARDSGKLACAVFNRADIPRQHMLALLKKASAAVRSELQLEAGRKAEEVSEALKLASQRLQETSREDSQRYANARLRVAALQQAGCLCEKDILAFARQGEFEEVVTAISELCGLPAGETERLIVEATCDRLFIVSRAIGLSWPCVRQLLLMSSVQPRSSEQLESLMATYNSIPRGSAAKTLQVHQLREKARGGLARRSRLVG